MLFVRRRPSRPLGPAVRDRRRAAAGLPISASGAGRLRRHRR
jgi:hypothetical protein